MTKQTISIRARDELGQCNVRVSKVPTDATVGEVVSSLRLKLNLPPNDASGPIQWSARRASDGSQLNATELVGDVLSGDEDITLGRNIDAGAGRK
jgi:hypothetical protein